MKKITALVVGLVLLVGLGVGTYLALNPQIFKPKASCTGSGCIVEVGLTPTTISKPANTDFDITLTLDTKGQEISYLQVVLKYPSDGNDLQLGGFELDPAIAAAGWSKRIANQTTSGTDKQIQFSASYNSSWNSNGKVNFAKMTLKGAQDTSKTLTFDTGLSKALSGVNATDILIQPTDTATITIGGGGTADTFYKCNGTSCEIDTSGGTGFPNDPSCNNSCSPTTKFYKCAGTSCVQDTAGGTAFPNDSTCNNTCTATTVTKYYKCSGTACVQDTSADATGFPDDSTCNNTCTSGAAAPKYKCNGNACVRDDAATGTTYTALDCNGACTGGGTTTVTPTVNTIVQGQKLAALPAKITGKAAANATLTLEIRSDPITGTATADANGNWTWYPKGTLAPGSHTLTVTDNTGKKATVTFTITAAATTPAPTTLPSSGVVENTMAISLAGLILLGLGFVALRL